MKNSTYDVMKKIIILIGIIAAILAILIPLRAKSQLLHAGRSLNLSANISKNSGEEIAEIIEKLSYKP